MKKTFELNNGVQIPSIGYGTWQVPEGEAAVEAIKTAIAEGYRHIDTAAIYKNEISVGKGIKESGINREDLFITSKVWNTERGYNTTLLAFEKTLKDLGLDYLDLYLIHWPATEHQFENWKELNAETWRALEKLYKDGKIRSIGVSNFMPHHLEELLKTAEITPFVNQIEFHPGYMQLPCVEFCRANNILIEAWGPLGAGDVLKNETLMAIAAEHNKSVAQVCLRWVLQNGALPLVKSITPQRIKDNLNIYDFELTAKNMLTINELTPCGGQYLNPDTVVF